MSKAAIITDVAATVTALALITAGAYHYSPGAAAVTLGSLLLGLVLLSKVRRRKPE